MLLFLYKYIIIIKLNSQIFLGTGEKMENKNPHINHRRRLYALTEKIGIENLTDIQAMELLLTYIIPRKDTNEIAHELLEEFGTFAGVLDAPISALERVSGVGHRTAQMISFMKGFFFLYRTTQDKNKKISFATKGQMMGYISNYLQDSKNEQLYVFGLNSKKEVIKVAKIAEGDETSVVVLPRVLIDFISAHRPHSVVIAHSHGNNPPTPSTADIAASNRISTIPKASNVKYSDCIIISNSGSYSFLDNALIL